MLNLRSRGLTGSGFRTEMTRGKCVGMEDCHDTQGASRSLVRSLAGTRDHGDGAQRAVAKMYWNEAFGRRPIRRQTPTMASQDCNDEGAFHGLDERLVELVEAADVFSMREEHGMNRLRVTARETIEQGAYEEGRGRWCG